MATLGTPDEDTKGKATGERKEKQTFKFDDKLKLFIERTKTIMPI